MPGGMDESPNKGESTIPLKRVKHGYKIVTAVPEPPVEERWGVTGKPEDIRTRSQVKEANRGMGSEQTRGAMDTGGRGGVTQGVN